VSNFFKRWSNLKAENTANKLPESIESQKSLVTDKGITDNSLPALNAEPQLTDGGLLKEPGSEEITHKSTQGPSLEDVGKLTSESDFTTFMNKDVAGDVHQAAMKKLFSDPHFNIMDGLDIYIDDYSIEDPLPEGMLEKMYQSTALGLFKPLEDEVANSDQSTLLPSNSLKSEPEVQLNSELNSESNVSLSKAKTGVPHQEQFDFTLTSPMDQKGEAVQVKNINNIEVENKDDHTGL